MDKEEGEKLKKTEVDDSKINYPDLPPNYVSIAMLQERWLYRKQQEEERQKALVDVKVKPTKGFSKTLQNSFDRGQRIEEGQHASDNQVRSRFPGVNGMAKNVNQEEFGEGKYRKIIHGVEKGPMAGAEDCSRRQGNNLSCNSGIERTASVFMIRAVPEIVSKEIKPVEFIKKSDGKTIKDRGNVGKQLSCNSGIEETASVFMVEAVPEIVSKEIKPVEFIKKSNGKTYKDRKNLRKNASCNADAGIDGRAIIPAKFIKKVDGKTVQDRGNPRKNLSCNSSDNEGTSSVSMVEAVPGIVRKEIKPVVELIRKSDGKTVQDKGNVRKSLSCNSGVERIASVSMVEAVPGVVRKEIKPAELIEKSDGRTDKERDNSRKNCGWRVKSSGRKSEVEESPENSMKKEDLGVLIGKNAPITGDDDGCVVEVLHENKETEGALLGSGHSKGSERFGGEVGRKWRKKTKAKKPSDSKDKNTLEETKEKGTEDEVLTGSNGSSLQKGTRGRKFQGYMHRENIVEDLGTKITGNFRDLSFVASRKSNMTSTRGLLERRGNFWKYPRYQVVQKPADNRRVWVKREEISATR